jgi:hypothetical protein
VLWQPTDVLPGACAELDRRDHSSEIVNQNG